MNSSLSWRFSFHAYSAGPLRFPRAPRRTASINTASPAVQMQAVTTKRTTFSHLFQECAHKKAPNPGKQAHAQMIVTGFKPTIFVTNCVIQMYVKCSNLSFAYNVFDKMPQRDTVSWNSMIFGFSERGEMMIAQYLFDVMPEKDVVSWNSLISGYLQNSDHQKSIDIFLQMDKLGVFFDHTTLAVVLKSCSSLEDHSTGVQIHGLAVKMGFIHDMVTGCSLVDMYAKCKNMNESLWFFNEMLEKNWICWSAVIAGFVQNDQFVDGLHLFKEMQRQVVGVSQSTYASVFRLCAGLSARRLGCQLHGHAIKTDFGSDAIVGTAALDMYAKCGNLIDAQKLFNMLPRRNLQSYNALMVGYAQSGRGFEALKICQLLHRSSLGFDGISLSVAFSAVAVIEGISVGCQLHGLALKNEFWANICVNNAILDMYGKCGALVEAQSLFDEMMRRDAVSWNAIIAAYEQNGKEEEALPLYISMLSSGMEPDEFTYGSVLKASAGQQASNHGMLIHGSAIKFGMGLQPFVGCALVDMYCKCGMMNEAMNLHDRIEEKDLVSWNAIISGYSVLKQDEEAQEVFSRMLEMGLKADNFTYATILDTCANLATVGLGKQIHAQIIKQEMQSDVFITSTLVDMYSKCGNMEDSRLMFEKSRKRDFVTWNAMLCGYAYHGFGEEALQLFGKMQMENVKPNNASFLAVLRACGHMGLVEEGLNYFYSMPNYGLAPQLEHHSSMVDILGRSGQVTNALKLIDEMPFEADDVIWRTLLSVCKIYGNVEVAEKAADSLLKLDPYDSSVYILLANIYADAGMWDKASSLRKEMRYNKVKKEPGCSWIELMGEVHTFLAHEKDHPNCEEIYEKLHNLYGEMNFEKYTSDTQFVGED
ncbi:hypothetical protein Nepgr_028518 [Nepenthes gracilis]|uniref:Pentatricopeptide repeat-containing protein n=1 Tax=Nepenthes gracilis TaxID=150966 RepID=A0AAD3TAH7_NEPGR|nr:hypothetical protein Nepgr_028518 [Nepenthes gracilis]